MKNNKQQQRPFEMQIRQMRKNRVILVNVKTVEAFASECANRGIELGIGSCYGNGVVLFEK